MYKHHPSLVLGFHACESGIAHSLLDGSKGFKESKNDFDWLGNGMYFWENSPHRAQAYGEELRDKRKKLKNPTVIGAVLHLGYCFDLLESDSLSVLKKHYDALTQTLLVAGVPILENEKAHSEDDDRLLRKLDCAVFQYMHSELKNQDKKTFDSVRGAFWEGDELYPTSGFRQKNHIQVCIRNPNCIKGFFLPREKDSHHSLV